MRSAAHSATHSATASWATPAAAAAPSSAHPVVSIAERGGGSALPNPLPSASAATATTASASATGVNTATSGPTAAAPPRRRSCYKCHLAFPTEQLYNAQRRAAHDSRANAATVPRAAEAAAAATATASGTRTSTTGGRTRPTTSARLADAIAEVTSDLDADSDADADTNAADSEGTNTGTRAAAADGNPLQPPVVAATAAPAVAHASPTPAGDAVARALAFDDARGGGGGGSLRPVPGSAAVAARGVVIPAAVAAAGGCVLYVTDLAGATFTLPYDPDAEVGVVMEQIKERRGIPIDQQRLIFHSKELSLQPRRTVADYNIQPDSTLFLVFKLRGS